MKKLRTENVSHDKDAITADNFDMKRKIVY